MSDAASAPDRSAHMPIEHEKLGWFAQRCPSVLTQKWRDMAREWASIGNHKCSEICHGIADYYALPMIQQIFGSHRLSVLHRELRKVQADD